MADTRKKPSGEDAPAPAEAAREAVADTEPKDDAIRFPISRLLGEDSRRLTGYTPDVMAGALHDVKEKELTVEEAKAAAKAWLNAPVKEG